MKSVALIILICLFSAQAAFDPSPPISADRGDNDVVLAVGRDSPIQIFKTTLTSARTVTLSNTGARNGSYFKIVRTGLGLFTLTVGVLKVVPSATSASVEVVFDGSDWVLVHYSIL